MQSVNHSPVVALLFFLGATFVAAAPLWLPLVFLAFVTGRRQMSLQLLFFFLTVEAICIAVVAAFLWSPLASPVW
jgi:hypothetical protein